jgi:general L-amino acid transport system permease protein
MNANKLKNPEKRILPPFEKSARWMKKNLFSSALNSVITIIIFCLIIKIITPLIGWVFIDGIWEGTAQTCREGSGACVIFIKEKFLFILFGFYPREELWRVITSLFIFLAALWWSKEPHRWNQKLLAHWAVILILIFVLMRGGYFSLVHVGIDQWGGLPLTLLLSFVGFVFSYPLGVLLALGRTGSLPLIRVLCVGFIELIRGVPMISLLFMASVMFPLFLPEGVNIPKILRAQLAIVLFMSAYLAEVFRGGLAAVDKGQYEAADSLGLSYIKKMTFVILPQALKIVIPPTVNTTIGMFKDTSLVVIIALFDLLMTTRTSLKDPKWLGFSLEGYIFVSFIYFVFCFCMSKYAKRLESEFNTKGHA